MGRCAAIPVIIGATPDAPIDVGESITRLFRYVDQGETPIDLAGATAEIHSSYPSFIRDEAIVETAEDEDGWYVSVIIPRATADKLDRPTRMPWFRLRVVLGEYSDDVTPQIGIQIR